jgi:predicted DCC family thiol-disulfide oxidoreductase YuxK
LIPGVANRPVVLFDGECNLCNRYIQFIIRHDKKKQFLFATLQSAAGGAELERLRKDTGYVPDSVILQYNNKYYIKSAAALHIFKLLGGWRRILYAGIIFPRFLRNAFYDFVARNRYKWFGKSDECMVPTPELRDRFLSK